MKIFSSGYLQVFEVEASDDVVRIVRVVGVFTDQMQLVVVVYTIPVCSPILIALKTGGLASLS